MVPAHEVHQLANIFLEEVHVDHVVELGEELRRHPKLEGLRFLVGYLTRGGQVAVDEAAVLSGLGPADDGVVLPTSKE